MKSQIKKIWKMLPVSAREFPLKFLCTFIAGKRLHEVSAPPDSPVYVFGNFQGGGGIARSAELYAAQLRQKSRHLICVDTTEEMLQQVVRPISDGSVRRLAEVQHDFGTGTIVVHLNPPQFQFLLCKLGRKFLEHKRIIAYWAWELENVPPLWQHAMQFVDAVEVPSTFTQIAIARNTHKQVTVRPHCVPTPLAVQESFGAGGKLRCLFIFDMASLCTRKNPQAVVAAFVQAFTPEQASLTIKIGQAQSNIAALKVLQNIIQPYPHIHIITDWLNSSALQQLYLAHDVYISLHRSEGYGLTIREAMLNNLYVVATGWSGNMDFMQGEHVFSVPYRLIPVNQKDGSFGASPNARWAEPDTEKAAQILQSIYQDIFGNLHSAPVLKPAISQKRS